MRALADDDPRYADLNREFHFTVYSCAGSPLLLTLMRLLWASLHGGPRVQRSHAESASQHDAILDALRSGMPPPRPPGPTSTSWCRALTAARMPRDQRTKGPDGYDHDRRRRGAARGEHRSRDAAAVHPRVRRRPPELGAAGTVLRPLLTSA